ncbi:MAG: PKD domain-containing protein, partial [Sediminibacterium sp.]
MPGSIGLLADPSSAEIDICPFVGNPDKYYIFYNAQTCSNLYYCVVDMSLAGGTGDVTNLNTLLNSSDFSEGLEIVKRDCDSYWLLAYECDIQFVKFLIDSNGIGSMQGIYNYPQPGAGYDGRGELDFHNGKLGIAFGFIPYAFVCDFDPIAGTISNPVTLNFPTADQFTGMYGIEFSPDATKAYISNWYNDQTNNIFQYDFLTLNIQSWKSSNQVSQQGGEDGPGQIELGKDSNLYVINNGVNEITVISNANSVTPTFSHIQTTSILALGVSDFIQSDLFHNNTFSHQNYCYNDTVFFNATVYSCNGAAVNILWNFGDPASGINNTDTSLATYHLFSSAGIYTVTMVVYDSTFTDTVTQTLNVFGIVPFNLGPDTVVCNTGTYTIGASILSATYLWSTGETTSHITVTTPGTYILKALLGPCFETDTITVNFAPGPSVNLGPDTTLCYTPSYTIDAGNPGMSYQWNNGDTIQVVTVDTTGTYTVTVTNGICTQTDSILVNFFAPPPLFLGNDS